MGPDGVTTTVRRAPPPPAAEPAELPFGPLAAVPLSSEAAEPDQFRWDLELALAALSIIGLFGFHRVFEGTAWVGPVFGCGLGVQLVCRLTRRWVPSRALAALIDIVSIAALTVWTVVPASTYFGLPLRGSGRAIQMSLVGIAARMNAATVPVRPVTGFLVLAAAGAGVVGAAGSWIFFRLDRTLGATIPSLAAFVMCCALGTRNGRSGTVILEILGVLAFVLIARLAAQSRGAWFAGRRTRATRATLRSAVPAIALAAVLALVIVPAVPGPDGHGPLGWRSAGEDSPRIVISPLVSLSTRLLHQSATTVFTVRSPVPSYWRLTSLDYFDGSEWNARDTYEGIQTKLPGVRAAPPGARTVREQFAVQNLDSVWLPLAFDPEAVTGAGKVSYDPRSGSLLTPKATSDHLDYTVTSLQYLATLSAKALRAAPPVPRSSSLAPYLQLPTSIPASVKKLAAGIVKGKKTEYARAIALQEYFYGPSFTYSLHPPTDGAGSAALTTFLFQTHTGYCQQFAGAYAVLARAIGLPTRLAIGFTAGRKTGAGYQVTDADAHTWPEVWFPRYGWVPFEPTKGAAGAGFSIPGATAYTGNTAAPTPTPGTRTRGSTATTVPPSSSATAAGAATRAGFKSPRFGSAGLGFGGFGPGAGGGTGTAPPAPPPHHKGHITDWVLLGIALAVTALIASNGLGRRLRWALRRRRRTRGPGPGRRHGPDAVAIVWEEVAERLAWHGIRRRGAETAHQFADRVAAERVADGEPPLGSNLHRLATLLNEAEFSGDAPSASIVQQAEQRGAQLASILGRDRSRLEVWALRLDPRWAWSPRTIEASKAIWLDVTLG
jgi:transglutaminase-like putative cysteine protease